MTHTPHELAATLADSIPRFEFRAENGAAGVCALSLHPIGPAYSLVIATELPENGGQSVTNAAELLATMAAVHWRLIPARLVWVECYPPDPTPARLMAMALKSTGRPPHRGRAAPTYDLVTFRHVDGPPPFTGAGATWPDVPWHFQEPEWRPLRSAGVADGRPDGPRVLTFHDLLSDPTAHVAARRPEVSA